MSQSNFTTEPYDCRDELLVIFQSLGKLNLARLVAECEQAFVIKENLARFVDELHSVPQAAPATNALFDALEVAMGEAFDRADENINRCDGFQIEIELLRSRQQETEHLLTGARQQLHDIEIQLQQTKEHLAAANGRIAAHGELANLLASRPDAVEGGSRRRTTGTNPDKFTGEEKDARKRYIEYKNWRNHIMMRWTDEPFLFPREMNKILHAAGLLGGDAFMSISTAIETIMENPNDDTKWSWKTGDELLKALDRKYMTLDIAAVAEQDITKLEQKEDYAKFSDFITMFESLCDQCSLDDSTKVRYLRRKVNRSIRDAIIKQPDLPGKDAYAAWVELLTKLARNQEDEDFYRKLEKEHRREPGRYDGNNNKEKAKDPDAMDLDKLNINKIAPQELARRIREGLCKRCGGADHYARDCTPQHRANNQNQRGRGGARGGATGHGGATRGGHGDYQQGYGYGRYQHNGGYNNNYNDGGFNQYNGNQCDSGGRRRGGAAQGPPRGGGWQPYNYAPHAPRGPALKAVHFAEGATHGYQPGFVVGETESIPDSDHYDYGYGSSDQGNGEPSH